MEETKRTTIMLKKETVWLLRDLKKFLYFNKKLYLKTYEDLIIFLAKNYLEERKNEGSVAKDEREEG